jgi:nucleoid DNA-binding protein
MFHQRKEGILAVKITAIRAYHPKLKRLPTMQNDEVVEILVQRTSLSEGELHHVVYSLRDILLMAHRAGQAVKIEGLGTFTPSIREGHLDINYRPDSELRRQLNHLHKLHAKIVNKDNLGKSADGLVALWNQEHPDDPVEG